MLSVPVQLIAWEDCPRNDLLRFQRCVKQLLTHSLTHSVTDSCSGDAAFCQITLTTWYYCHHHHRHLYMCPFA